MKIEPSLPLPIMTPGKRQLVQCPVSLVPHKRHAEKRERFSLSFSLFLPLADNAFYRTSFHTVPMVTIHLDFLPPPHILPRDLPKLINFEVRPRLTFSPTLTIPPVKIEELKLPPPKPPEKADYATLRPSR
jgi:hypothetical protein